MDLPVGYFIFRAVFFLRGGSLWTCLARAPNPRDWRDSVRKRWVGDTHSIIRSLASPPVDRKICQRMVRWGLGGKNVGRSRLWHLLCNVKTWLVELVLTMVQMKAKKTHVTHYIHWQNITKSLFRGQKVQKVCILSSEFIYRGQSTVDGCPIIKSGQIYLYSAFENNTDLQNREQVFHSLHV